MEVTRNRPVVHTINCNDKYTGKLRDILPRAYQVLPLTNLQTVETTIRAMHPALILFHYQPGVNDFSWYQHLRTDGDTADIPLICVLDRPSAAQIADVFAAGATDFLLIDASPQTIKARLTPHLQLQNQQKEDTTNKLMAHLLQENTFVGLMLFDLDGNYLIINHHLATILNGKPDDFIGKNIRDVMPHEAKFHLKRFAHIIQTRQGDLFEDYFDSPSGPRWFAANAEPVMDKNGAVIAIQIVTVDITGHKQATEALKESARLLRQISNNYPNAYLSIIEKDFSIGYTAGPEFAKRGLDPDQFVGLQLAQVFGDHAPLVQTYYERTFQGEDTEFELFLENQYQLYQTRPLPNPNGEIDRILVVVQNNTARRQQEATRAAQLHLLQFAEEHSLAKTLEETLNQAEKLTHSEIGFYHFLEADQKTLSLQQWSTNTQANMCQAEGDGLHYAVDEAGVWADCVRQRQTIIHNDYATLSHRKGLPAGHAPIKRQLVAPVLRGDRIVAVIGVGNKMTDYTQPDAAAVTVMADLAWEIVARKKAEKSLKISNARFRSLFENNHSVMLMIDPEDGRILDANPAAANFYGWPLETLRGKKISDINTLNPDQIQQEMQAARSEARHYFNFEHRLASGALRNVEVYSGSITWHNRESLYSIIHDVTERKKAEDQLRLLTRAIEQSPVSVIITDLDAVIQYVNPKFSQVTGYSHAEALGQTPRLLKSDHHSDSFYRDLWTVLRTGQEWRGEFFNRRKDGSHFWELASISSVKNWQGEITNYVAVKEEITHRKQREEEHVRQERLAAVGQLAAGIAHDFNNMLTPMIGFAQLLQHQYDLPPEMSEKLDAIVEQGHRAANLTQQILDFSRQTVNQPHPLDLKLYLNETLKFIKRTIPESIKIRLNFDLGDYTINADPAQLQQVITNLAVNARDAMPDGGTLSFNLSQIQLEAADMPPCTGLAPGLWAKLAIKDTGSGIPDAVLPHIFEPFFTTKQVGQGTGLGLAQVYGIISQHQGCITVKSKTGQGTTFSIYLALVPEETETPQPKSNRILMGHGEKILLVEDDETVLAVTQTMLETLNYQVFSATDGSKALQRYLTDPTGFDLILTDAVMPNTDGFSLAQALHDAGAATPILVMTGYAKTIKNRGSIPSNIFSIMAKPINMQQLAQTLRAALDSKKSTPSNNHSFS